MIEEVHDEAETSEQEVETQPEVNEEQEVEVNWQEKAAELEKKAKEIEETLERTKNGTQTRINELTRKHKEALEQLQATRDELSQWKGEPATPEKVEQNQSIDYKTAEDYGRFKYEVDLLRQSNGEVFQKLGEATKLGINPFMVNPEIELMLARQQDGAKLLPEIVNNNGLMDKLLRAQNHFDVASVFGEARASLNYKDQQQPAPPQEPVNKPVKTPSAKPASSGSAPATGRKTAEQLLAEMRSRR